MAEIAGKPAPKLSIPADLARFLDWFRQLDENYRPLFDGGLHPIGPWLAQWEKDSGTLLDYADRRIILAIDCAYREGMAKVRADYMRHQQSQRDRS